MRKRRLAGGGMSELNLECSGRIQVWINWMYQGSEFEVKFCWSYAASKSNLYWTKLGAKCKQILIRF